MSFRASRTTGALPCDACNVIDASGNVVFSVADETSELLGVEDPLLLVACPDCAKAVVVHIQSIIGRWQRA